ncbi:MAG TPA: RDD family protein [Gemmatimonadales bacterium]|nr:RDD family protein [Gemmatimonadales bacterium]
MDAKRLEQLWHHYRALSDAKIAELHAEGPAAYASPESWELLDREFRRRGAGVEAQEDEVIAAWRDDVSIAETESNVTARRAPLGERIGAIAVDAVTLAALAVMMGWAAGDWGIGAALLIAVLYYPVTELLFQKTLGKAALKLRVVRLDGSRPGLGAILIRALVRPLSVMSLHSVHVVLAGAFRGWKHDLISRTQVIRETASQSAPAPSSDDRVLTSIMRPVPRATSSSLRTPLRGSSPACYLPLSSCVPLRITDT